MNALRFPATIALALLIAAPALLTIPEDAGAALGTLLGALLFSWLGVAAIYRLVDGFAHANRRREVEDALEGLSPHHEGDTEQVTAAS